MDGILGKLVGDMLGSLALVALFAIPPALMLVWLFRTKRSLRRSSVEPFTDRPLRPPGESLRLKIEKLQEEFENSFLLTIGAPLAAGYLLAISPVPKQAATIAFLFLLCAGWVALRARKFMLQVRALWNHRLGFDGERVVGEEINQLMLTGHLVFHDVPFDDFNVDHVVVGPAGVYAIETKTRRKPKSPEAGKKYKVIFDGKSLQWPWGGETKSVEQAERGAAALAKWLTSATGERVQAKSVLLIPGWWVELAAVGTVAVLNPKQVHAALPLPGATPLNSAQITRIAHQLRERCRMESV